MPRRRCPAWAKSRKKLKKGLTGGRVEGDTILTSAPPDLPQGPRRGYFISPTVVRAIRLEPCVKRTVSFIDGQNLYRHAKFAFGHHHPNYDPIKLSEAICATHAGLGPSA